MLPQGVHRICSEVVVVSVSPDVQLARLMRRDGTTEPEAASRINAQMPLAEKVQRADVIIDNDGNETALNRKIAEYGAPLASGAFTFVARFSLDKAVIQLIVSFGCRATAPRLAARTSILQFVCSGPVLFVTL
eukprot:COSAG02_NODE_994_length_15358_cov_42.651812_4_plen_133_part_00